MTARESFEKEIAILYNEQQLDSVVRGILGKPLKHFVASAPLPAMIIELMDELETDQEAFKSFISHLIVSGSSLEIKGAARNYLDAITGVVSNDQNPYMDLVVLGHPFADRQSLRVKLKDILDSPYFRTLSANGPRYCGRSHSRILVRHVGTKIGVKVAYIDLLRKSVEDMIADLINEMQLNVKDIRDRMAQVSTQTKGFLSALRGVAQNEFVRTNTRWCIVFDHHDLYETPPERKEFAELLIEELMENTIPNVWVIMLGLGTCQYLPQQYLVNIEDVQLAHLGLTDIQNYIKDLHYQKNKKAIDQQVLNVEVGKVLNGFTLPLSTRESMDILSGRLRKYF